MHERCARGLVRPGALGLAALLVTHLLVAKGADEMPRESVANPRTQQAATQPAPATAPGEVQPTDRWQTAARARLISGLMGSKHDFSKDGTSGRDLCLPCHTPHLVGAPPPRLDRRPSLTLPMRPYQAPGIELSGWSLLCLGCHDGVTAPDVYSSTHAVSLASQLADPRFSTRGLRSHPVGVRYPIADEKYHPPAAVEAGGLVLPNGRIQCTTCHEAHNTNRHAHMLHISDERSRLCLTCHRL